MATAKHRSRRARATGAAATVNKAGRAKQLDTRTLLEATQLSKMLQEKWGVSAAAPVAAVPGAPAAAKKAGDGRDTSPRKATTFRLDPALQAGLAVLGQVLKKPLNRLVNEAVRGFIDKCSAEVEADLERTLERLKAFRKKDPHFESAIAQFVETEATLGRDDPMEGRPRPAAGPAQTMVHDLLRG